MFGSTAILPPRTNRWAVAKVLADCIRVKVGACQNAIYWGYMLTIVMLDLQICKLYLYNNEHAMALSHHSSHMRMFSDLSRGWGIGEETFEFWSWLARQCVSYPSPPVSGHSISIYIDTVYLPNFSNKAHVQPSRYPTIPLPLAPLIRRSKMSHGVR